MDRLHQLLKEGLSNTGREAERVQNENKVIPYLESMDQRRDKECNSLTCSCPCHVNKCTNNFEADAAFHAVMHAMRLLIPFEHTVYKKKTQTDIVEMLEGAGEQLYHWRQWKTKYDRLQEFKRRVEIRVKRIKDKSTKQMRERMKEQSEKQGRVEGAEANEDRGVNLWEMVEEEIVEKIEEQMCWYNRYTWFEMEPFEKPHQLVNQALLHDLHKEQATEDSIKEELGQNRIGESETERDKEEEESKTEQDKEEESSEEVEIYAIHDPVEKKRRIRKEIRRMVREEGLVLIMDAHAQWKKYIAAQRQIQKDMLFLLASACSPRSSPSPPFFPNVPGLHDFWPPPPPGSPSPPRFPSPPPLLDFEMGVADRPHSPLFDRFQSEFDPNGNTEAAPAEPTRVVSLDDLALRMQAVPAAEPMESAGLSRHPAEQHEAQPYSCGERVTSSPMLSQFARAMEDLSQVVPDDGLIYGREREVESRIDELYDDEGGSDAYYFETYTSDGETDDLENESIAEIKIENENEN